MKSTKITKKRHTRNQLPKPADKQPFIEHVHELRKRLFYIVASVALFSGAAYSVEHHIVDALLRPSHNQRFIYTSPGGGLDFLFRVCLYVGIACSIPVIVYQLLRYLEPLLKFKTRRVVILGSFASGFLAVTGMTFGYFVGLPSALHFLLNQFVTKQITPLITIQSYMSFVTVYMLGSALLLQIPLILLIINRIKPLTPKKLFSFGAERWVIVGSLIGAAMMNPNPNPVALFLVSGPLILAYQIGAIIIWVMNKRDRKPEKFQELLSKDAEIQANRLAAAKQALPLRATATITAVATKKVALKPVPVVAARVAARSSVQQTVKRPARPRPQRYINDFAPRRSSYDSSGVVSNVG